MCWVSERRKKKKKKREDEFTFYDNTTEIKGPKLNIYSIVLLSHSSLADLPLVLLVLLVSLCLGRGCSQLFFGLGFDFEKPI